MPQEERRSIVRALMAYGHSGAKAIEVAIDAERGDKYAIDWVNRAIAFSCEKTTERAMAKV